MECASQNQANRKVLECSLIDDKPFWEQHIEPMLLNKEAWQGDKVNTYYCRQVGAI